MIIYNHLDSRFKKSCAMKTKLPFLVSQCLKSLRSERRPFLFVPFASPSLATYLFPAQAWKQLIESHRLMVLNKKKVDWAGLSSGFCFFEKESGKENQWKKNMVTCFLVCCACVRTLRFLKKSLLGDGWSIKLPSVALSWLCKMCVCFSYGF